MSGGSFDYAYYRVESFVDELCERIESNGTKDEYGYSPNYSPEVLSKLSRIADESAAVAKKMKDVELMYSGDISEETFLERSNG